MGKGQEAMAQNSGGPYVGPTFHMLKYTDRADIYYLRFHITEQEVSYRRDSARCGCIESTALVYNLTFNPLKPSVVTWLHFECSAP